MKRLWVLGSIVVAVVIAGAVWSAYQIRGRHYFPAASSSMGLIVFAEQAERENEAAAWNSPKDLRELRSTVAARLMDDTQEFYRPDYPNTVPPPQIAVEKQALARIDARLKQLP